jgi:hypothetical protein
MAYFNNRNNGGLPGEIINLGYGLVYLPAADNQTKLRASKAVRTGRQNRPRRRRFSFKGLFTF